MKSQQQRLNEMELIHHLEQLYKTVIMKIDIDKSDCDICFCGSNLKYAACCKIGEGKLELIWMIDDKIDITKCTKTESINKLGNPIIVFHYNNEDVCILRNPKSQRQRIIDYNLGCVNNR
jgi:hypothetical protein